ncbi:MAG: hypothetical protein IRY96_03885 [Burkholderiales bacterium]|nr:hypothetical protein [Burkholderiales bacterium]
MANNIFTPPSKSGYRSQTDTKQENGNIINAPRYPEVGGFSGSNKLTRKFAVKQDKPSRRS